MPLFQVLLILVVLGFLLWAVLTYVPMPRPFPQLIIAVAVIGVVLFLVSLFLPSAFTGIRIGR